MLLLLHLLGKQILGCYFPGAALNYSVLTPEATGEDTFLLVAALAEAGGQVGQLNQMHTFSTNYNQCYQEAVLRSAAGAKILFLLSKPGRGSALLQTA